MMLTSELTHAAAPAAVHDFALGKQTLSLKREAEPVVDQQQNKKATGERAQRIVEDINEHLQSINTEVNFSVDKDTEKIVLRIVNGKTGELIRQIPAEDALRISSHLNKLLGLLIDANV